MKLLLGCGLPDAVPVFRRGGSGKGGDAGQKFERGAVIFANFEAILEGFFSLSPLLLSVKLKGDGVGVAQLKSCGVQFADSAEEFIDANRLRFPVHGHKVDFPRFDFEFGQAVAVFVDDEIGAVDFVYALQARRNIYGVSDDGEGFCGGGADGANQRVACGQRHPDMEPRNISAQPCDLRNILFDLSKGGAHFQAGEAGIACVILPFGKRSGPKGHDSVSNKLIHDSMVLANA